MSSERYDVVLKALNGPLAAMGEQKFQGPLVRVGTNPGPGGMALTGYRGIDARQAVITAYGEGEATVGPVGTNQVRLAPHPHVNWKDIDPLNGPEYLNSGAAIHLGPVGRGCTIQFVRVEKLGVWTAGRVGSATENVQAVEVSAPVAAKKAAPRRSVARIAAATLPIWFVGCMGLLVAVTAAVLIVVGWQVGRTEREVLGPIVEGEEYYKEVDPEKSTMDEQTLKGLNEAFRRFHAQPSADRAQAAGMSRTGHITDPDRWDDRYFKYVAASVEKHVESKNFFRRLDVVREEYAEVLAAVRRAGLPEAIAAVPYTESRYRPDLQSPVCAKGYWQFMPEVARRVEVKGGLEFRVRDCEITRPNGSTFAWTPKRLTPPRTKDSVYIDQAVTDALSPERCLIAPSGGCRVDDRGDLDRSTEAAIYTLKEAWEDDTLAASGTAVAATILSHNGGYDDLRFGLKKSFNVLPAFKAWSKGKDEDQHHLFYGANIKCKKSHGNPNFCGSKLFPETQHYAYNILAQHVLAVCYYGKNYADTEEQFRSWDSLLTDTGYCSDFGIPTAKQVKDW